MNHSVFSLPTFQLSGKVALVTGGTTGIGRASAELLHAAGAHVVVTGQNPESLELARRELPPEVRVVRVDARAPAEAERLARELEQSFGRLDVLFLNAGIAKLAPLEAVDEAFYAEHMDVNVKGVFFTFQKMLPLMSAGASVIVNTSVAATRGAAQMSVYSATKGAAAALTRSLAAELAGRGIRVNAVSPATIRTKIQEKFGLPSELQSQVERAFTSKIPLARFGTASEAAQAVLFLASPASSYMTGVELEVDGGLSAVA